MRTASASPTTTDLTPGAQPAAVLSVPRDPGVLKTPAGGRRRIEVVLFEVVFGLGLLALVIGIANRYVRPHISAGARPYFGWVAPAQTVIAEWVLPAGVYVLALCAAAAMARLLWWAVRRRHRQLLDKVMTACSAGTRVPVSQLRLSRQKWARHRGGLISARLRYRPPTAVISDQAKTLTDALRPFVADRVTISWVKAKNQFEIRPRPSRVEERLPEIGKVVDALSHLLGSVTVDQRHSTVGTDGSVQQVLVSYSLTTKDIGDGFRQRVQAVLDSKAPSPTGYWQITWETAANRVKVAPAEPLPTKAAYPMDMPADDAQDVIPIGVGEGGKTVHWRPKQFPHLVVVGRTGSGKTVFLSSLMISCLMRGWIILLLDPKELSFRGFDPRSLIGRGLPTWGGIEAVATTESEMEEALTFFHENMRNRYAAIKGFEISEDDLPPVLMIVDETGEFVERLTSYHTSEEKLEDLQARAEAEGRSPGDVVKPKGTKNPELGKVWSGLRLGRQSKDQIALGLQRPDVTFIPGEARSNATTKVSLGRLDGAGLEMMGFSRDVRQRTFEMVVDPATGQRMRQQIKGRATVDVGQGPQTIQTYYLPDPADAIIGKLSAVDVELVDKLRELVARSRQRWAWQKEAPTLTGRRGRVTTALFDKELSNSQRLDTDHDDGAGAAAVELDVAGDFESIRIRDVEEGQQIVLNVDGQPTTVEVESIEEDPDFPDELQISYRITGDGDTAGQPGVTTYAPDEYVQAVA